MFLLDATYCFEMMMLIDASHYSGFNLFVIF